VFEVKDTVQIVTIVPGLDKYNFKFIKKLWEIIDKRRF